MTTSRNPRPSWRATALASMLATVPFAAPAATIGFIAPLSGPQALVGQDQVDGFMLALEQLGGKLGGAPANVVKEDDQLKPEVGQQIVRKLIDKDKVDAIVGLSFSNVLMGSLPRLAESGVVAIATNAGPSPIAGAQCKANLFSMAWQNDGAAEAMGKFAQDRGMKDDDAMQAALISEDDLREAMRKRFGDDTLEQLERAVLERDGELSLRRKQAQPG